jgi:hypothetical protein
MHLQRTIGNQAVLRLLHANAEGLEVGSDTSATTHFAHDFSRIPVHSKTPAKLQAKLKVNTPGDSYEQEADRVSEQVMHMTEMRVQRACACGGGCSKCQKEQPGQEPERSQTKRVQASDTGQIAAPPLVHEVLATPGRPLDLATRAFMEPLFGHDFSHVRVHTGARAAESAKAIGASAYTVGTDVVFAEGRFQHNSANGRRLLAHELSHVVQQSGVKQSASMVLRAPMDEESAPATALGDGTEMSDCGTTWQDPKDLSKVAAENYLRTENGIEPKFIDVGCTGDVSTGTCLVTFSPGNFLPDIVVEVFLSGGFEVSCRRTDGNKSCDYTYECKRKAKAPTFKKVECRTLPPPKTGGTAQGGEAL